MGDASRVHAEERGLELTMLTPLEEEAVALSGKLAGMVREIIGDGPCADGDWAEMAAAIHVIQRAILSNSTARQYPGVYRGLGETLRK